MDNHHNNRHEDHVPSVNRTSAPSQELLTDPLDVLPIEIWEEIIYESAQKVREEDIHITSVDWILLLTLVSTRWRTTLLGCPRFWTDIELAQNMDDLEAKITLQIVLSNKLPLFLFWNELGRARPIWERCSGLIATQHFRIGMLSIRDTSPFCIDLLVKKLGTVPLLRHIHMGRINGTVAETPSWLDFIQSAHCIQSISGSLLISHNTLAYISMKNIRALVIRSNGQWSLPYLARLPYLESVEIDYSAHQSPETPPPLEGSLLSWKRITVSSANKECLENILLRVAPTLNSLQANVRWSELAMVLNRCSKMENLWHLALDVYDAGREEDRLSLHSSLFNALPITPSPIKDLKLSLYDLSYDELDKELIRNLFSIFMRWAPSVQNLRISASSSGCKPMIYYACSLNHLRSVNFDFVKPKDMYGHSTNDEYEEESGMDTELKVEDFRTNYEGFMHRIKTKNVLHLRSISSVSILRSSQWISLCKLGLTGDAADWSGITLPNLREVFFDAINDITKTAPGMTALCQEIATDPMCFPSLQKMGTHSCPEWDILFIMLERRNINNLYQSSHSKAEYIKPIKYLDIWGVPSMDILLPLTRLLGGRITSRPTNFELSLAWEYQGYRDPNLSGCITCHRLHRYCKHMPRVEIEDSMEPESAVEYPEAVDDIFVTRLARLDQWKRLLTRGRLNRYRRYKHQVPSQITEHTLDGLTYTEEGSVIAQGEGKY